MTSNEDLMLYRGRDLIPNSEKKAPYWIVGQRSLHGKECYIEQFGVASYPTAYSDEILEHTENMHEALLFCRKEDAEEVCQDRCVFRCNCGSCENVGLVLKVELSKREKEGVTYGTVECSKPDSRKEWFETVFDVSLYKEFKREK